ncbi:hypothetical protein LOK49_LG12G00566 [Camellia lanceoleosa]|uniref:Uncharacterized protein n=1 Tax=Camellia lanceoleosa TaxID=1840588 RepID=A0ACC0FVG7_9ERIC|nr:hypothetical protein LOK49_LG12G00566 [Camellia lanceoleosa]
MAVSANRSPSPISTRPNPNSRTPETNSNMRRSFSANPFARPSILTNPRSLPPATPANSPADFARRHSVGKEGGVSSRSYEEKENEKDQNLKPVKIRSPAVSKGTKNFMTPTISAASKINSSPRKKVLAERNEPVRTSISFSGGKNAFGSLNLSDLTEDIDSKSEMGLNQNMVDDSNESAITNSDHNEAVLEISSIPKASKKDSQVPLNSQKVSESLPDMKPVESNCTSAGTGCKNKLPDSSMSPIIAPLDADPSLRPYDPKTNYLSPRPRFLHYRPNPRIERLEESFLSESFSDTEVTEVTTESESLQKESEDDSSSEAINEEVEVEPLVSEPKPSNAPISTQISKETVEAKIKPRFFTRSKSVALLLVLLIACLSVSVTDSPVFDLPVYKDLSMSKFYDPSEIAEFVKASLDGFAGNFKRWSANSVCYLTQLIRNLYEVDKLVPLQFSNLTYSLEDPFVNGYLKVDNIEERWEGIHEHNELETVPEEEVEIELLEEKLEKGDPDVEDDDNSEKALEERHGIEAAHFEPDSSDTTQNQEQSDAALPITSNPQRNIGFEYQPALTAQEFRHEVEALEVNPEVVETGEILAEIDLSSSAKTAHEFRPEVEVLQANPEMVETGEIQADIDLSSGAKIEPTIAEANPESSLEMSSSFHDIQSSKVVDSLLNWSKYKVSVHNMQPMFLLALALVAATTFIYLRYKRTATTANAAAVLVDPLLMNKKTISIPEDSTGTQNISHDRPTSQIWPPDFDVVGESCPSEMSSFQKSSSHSKRGPSGTNEAQSQDRKQRKVSKRESLASSSEYSMDESYGSFTTYEKIPIKHGCGEEEIVTPVRRSSRIKNHQVTSP